MINSINILNFEVHFYSLCILLGIIISYIVITKEAKRQKINEDLVTNLIFYGILIGIIGARLYYVIFNFDYYINNLSEIYKIWHGGLAIHGGILFGILFIYFYTKKHNMKFLKTLDIIAPGVIIAQGIGRWGNFFNQEAYGMMVSKSLLQNLLVPDFIINGMKINGSYYLPTFYFESIISIIGFIIMLIIRRKNIKVGTLTGFYLIWYSSFRFIIEYFRTDSLMIFNLKQAMIISIIGIIIGLLIVFKKNKELYNKE